MKGCAILLLLLCGMIHSAYSDDTSLEALCLFGDKIYEVGVYTARPCMRMICDTNGDLSFEGCPKFACKPGMEIIDYVPEKDGPPYPDCCSHPICIYSFYKNS